MNEIGNPMVEGLTHSPTIGAIGEALSIAQGEMSGAKKDASNPFFKSRYADLASIVSAIREPLSNHKIAHIQTPGHDKDGPFVDTMLLHASGEWIKGRIRIQPIKFDPQSIGSVITYMRRYALQSIVGLEADDDDGNKATSRDQQGLSPLPLGGFENIPPFQDNVHQKKIDSDGVYNAKQAISDTLAVANWRNEPFIYGKKSAPNYGKLLGTLSATFLDDMWRILQTQTPHTPEGNRLKEAFRLRSLDSAQSRISREALEVRAKNFSSDQHMALVKIAQRDLDDPAPSILEMREATASHICENWDSIMKAIADEMDTLP